MGFGPLIKDSGFPWTTTTPIRPISVGYDMELHVAITFYRNIQFLTYTVQTSTMMIPVNMCYYLKLHSAITI